MTHVKRIILILSVLIASIYSGDSRSEIVISEVFYNANGVDTGKEWIEIWNRDFQSNIWLKDFDLTSSNKHYIFPDFTLFPGQTAVIHWNTAGTDNQTELYTGTSLKNMGDSSDYVALFGSDETIVDYLRYYDGTSSEIKTWEQEAADAGIWVPGEYIPAVIAGHSIELEAGKTGDTAADYFQQYSPTPGTHPQAAPEPAPQLLFIFGYLLFRLSLRPER